MTYPPLINAILKQPTDYKTILPGGVLLLLDVEDPLFLLDVGRDQVVEEEEGFGVGRHEDVVVKVWKMTALESVKAQPQAICMGMVL